MMHDHDLEDGIEFTTVNAKPNLAIIAPVQQKNITRKLRCFLS